MENKEQSSKYSRDAVASSSRTIAAPCFDSMKDIENYLVDMMSSANESGEAAINAQLQVVRYVQSPELIGSTFDLMLHSARISIKLATSYGNVEQMRETMSLVINNYIFFLQTKLDARSMLIESEESVVRENARQLIVEGAEMMAKTIVKVADTSANAKISGDAITSEIIKIVVDQVFSEGPQERSFFCRVVDWMMGVDKVEEAKQKLAQERYKFHKVLFNLFGKLERSRKMLGANPLIYELIEQYKYQTVDGLYRPSIEKVKQERNDWYSVEVFIGGIPFTTCILLVIASILHFIVLFIRWIYHLVASLVTTSEAGWADGQWKVYYMSMAAVVGLALLYYIIVTLVSWFRIIPLKRKQKKTLKYIESVQKLYEFDDIGFDFD